MPKVRRILVTGCARSGNTLMCHLLGTGYRNTRILRGERVPQSQEAKKGPVVIGKRPGALRSLGTLLEQPDFGAVLMMRDPRDTITSKHWRDEYWTNSHQWIKAARLIDAYRDHERILLVFFESLLKYPLLVQQYVAERFSLTPSRPFSECHQYFDVGDAQGIAAMHGARPIDRSRIGHWQETPEKRARVVEAFKQVPELSIWMDRFGYNHK